MSPSVYTVPDTEGQIRDWENRIACVELVGEKLSRFLQKAFPGCDEEACELGGAVSAYLGHGFQQQIEGLKAYQANPPKAYGSPYATVEGLAHFVEERDAYQAQLNQLEEIASGMDTDEKTGFMAKAVRMQIVSLDLPRKIAEAEERIRTIQRDMEKAEA